MNLRRLRIDEGSDDDNVQHLPPRSRSGRCPSCRCSSRTSRSGGGSGGWSVKGPEQRADGEMPFLGQRQTPTLRATHHGLKIEKDWTKPKRVMPAGKHIGFMSGIHCLSWPGSPRLLIQVPSSGPMLAQGYKGSLSSHGEGCGRRAAYGTGIPFSQGRRYSSLSDGR